MLYYRVDEECREREDAELRAARAEAHLENLMGKQDNPARIIRGERIG